MTKRDKLILVIGATGQQGVAVIKALHNTEFGIRALVRPHPRTAAKREKVTHFEQQGVQIATVDLDDFNSLVQAMDGVYGVFSITTFFRREGYKER